MQDSTPLPSGVSIVFATCERQADNAASSLDSLSRWKRQERRFQRVMRGHLKQAAAMAVCRIALVPAGQADDEPVQSDICLDRREVLDGKWEVVVSVLPDWNSIESTTRWSEGLFWAGVVALILVAAAELAAHIYSNRAAYLVSAHARNEAQTDQIQERETEGRYSADVASIQQKLDNANAERASIQQKLEDANAKLQKFESGKARHLSDPQTNALLKSLAPFAGQTIKVWCSGRAWDSVTLGREFIAVLKMAGWVVPDGVLSGPVAGGDTEGIRVAFEGSLSDPSEIPPGIDALISTLGQSGLISDQTLYLDGRAHGGDYLLKVGR